MDALGDRMKSQYENRTRYYLPRRCYTIYRIDGKSFHVYTKGLNKPYDKELNQHMDETARFLVNEIQGCLFVYTQSDEISCVAQDFAQQDTQAWFDNNLQKVCSISASITTAKFNSLRSGKLAFFDSRVFTIADPAEVANYFVWRTRDAIRNSINMLGQAHFSHQQLHKKNTGEVREMLHEIDVHWEEYEPRFKTGSLQTKNGYVDIPTTNLYDFYKSLLVAEPQ